MIAAQLYCSENGMLSLDKKSLNAFEGLKSQNKGPEI